MYLFPPRTWQTRQKERKLLSFMLVLPELVQKWPRYKHLAGRIDEYGETSARFGSGHPTYPPFPPSSTIILKGCQFCRSAQGSSSAGFMARALSCERVLCTWQVMEYSLLPTR